MKSAGRYRRLETASARPTHKSTSPRRLQPFDPSVDRRKQLGVERGISGRNRGHLELVPRAQQAMAVERLPPTVGNHTARLDEAEPRCREIVWGVVQHL